MVSLVLSLIMHRLVSRDTLTVASNGIWNATLMYCVRIVGTCTYERTREIFLISIMLTPVFFSNEENVEKARKIARIDNKME